MALSKLCEVVVVQVLALGWGTAEHGAASLQNVRAVLDELGVHEEEFLLQSTVGLNVRMAVIPCQPIVESHSADVPAARNIRKHCLFNAVL